MAGDLPAIARRLADAGCFRWRGEAFDIRAEPDGPVLARLDRGALPSFGVLAVGVHVNGLVRRPGRAACVDRAGGRPTRRWIPASWTTSSPAACRPGSRQRRRWSRKRRRKPPSRAALAAQAAEVATISYAMERHEGLRRDLLHCYDLELPEDFVPHAADGEVEAFELWPIERVLQTVRDTDAFKFNVNLVLIDLFRRHGLPTD